MDYLLTLDNKPYVNEVWPGDSVFPNYFDSKCREYVTNEAISYVLYTCTIMRSSFFKSCSIVL